MWGLAQKLYGNGAQWTSFGYQGDPRNLQIGAVINVGSGTTLSGGDTPVVTPIDQTTSDLGTVDNSTKSNLISMAQSQYDAANTLYQNLINPTVSAAPWDEGAYAYLYVYSCSLSDRIRQASGLPPLMYCEHYGINVDNELSIDDLYYDMRQIWSKPVNCSKYGNPATQNAAIYKNESVLSVLARLFYGECSGLPSIIMHMWVLENRLARNKVSTYYTTSGGNNWKGLALGYNQFTGCWDQRGYDPSSQFYDAKGNIVSSEVDYWHTCVIMAFMFLRNPNSFPVPKDFTFTYTHALRGAPTNSYPHGISVPGVSSTLGTYFYNKAVADWVH